MAAMTLVAEKHYAIVFTRPYGGEEKDEDLVAQ